MSLIKTPEEKRLYPFYKKYLVSDDKIPASIIKLIRADTERIRRSRAQLHLNNLTNP